MFFLQAPRFQSNIFFAATVYIDVTSIYLNSMVSFQT